MFFVQTYITQSAVDSDISLIRDPAGVRWDEKQPTACPPPASSHTHTDTHHQPHYFFVYIMYLVFRPNNFIQLCSRSTK